MRLTTTTAIGASADDVWRVFAHRFDRADEWMASVPRSYANDSGASFEGAHSTGRICELQPDGAGMKASERFVAYDDAGKVCSIRVDFVDAPPVFPVHHNALDFSVVDDPGGGSTATWAFGAKIKPWAYVMWPLLWRGMTVAWKELCEEFQHYVETGIPHPRKVAAIEKARLASNA